MTLLAVGKVLSAVPGWVYAAIVVLALVGFGYWHVASQRDEAREALKTAQDEIRRLDGDNRTLKSNNEALVATNQTQGDSIAKAARMAEAKQAETAAALAAAAARQREADARIKALKAIQESGDRSQGANYAFDARRNIR